VRSAGDLDALIAGVREARPRAIGRAISLIENGSADLPRLARALASLRNELTIGDDDE